jgi:hypothetical protein
VPAGADTSVGDHDGCSDMNGLVVAGFSSMSRAATAPSSPRTDTSTTSTRSHDDAKAPFPKGFTTVKPYLA